MHAINDFLVVYYLIFFFDFFFLVLLFAATIVNTIKLATRETPALFYSLRVVLRHVIVITFVTLHPVSWLCAFGLFYLSLSYCRSLFPIKAATV